MEIITQEQYARLKKLKRRLKNKPYELSNTLVFATMLIPGTMTVIAHKAAVYDKVVRLIKRVLPNVKLEYEHGTGWHYGDRTEYHYGAFTFIVR